MNVGRRDGIYFWVMVCGDIDYLVNLEWKKDPENSKKVLRWNSVLQRSWTLRKDVKHRVLAV